ncbi:hypothetical protein NDU88_001990 [Pleurodeles waltl]|uniref:Uncharacterized protein n=1 Tax=Pleurodeles waltl TaxID=8319 RepID=A0AAV7U9I1_PLEWA|nr:hypothetical protein NDU88_001990 [Pleurodeles waltl]
MPFESYKLQAHARLSRSLLDARACEMPSDFCSNRNWGQDALACQAPQRTPSIQRECPTAREKAVLHHGNPKAALHRARETGKTVEQNRHFTNRIHKAASHIPQTAVPKMGCAIHCSSTD